MYFKLNKSPYFVFFLSFAKTFFIFFVINLYPIIFNKNKFQWKITKIINNSKFRDLPLNFLDKLIYKNIVNNKNNFYKIFYKEAFEIDRDLKLFDYFYNKDDVNIIYFSNIFSTAKYYHHNNKGILHEKFIIKFLKKIISLFKKNLKKKDNQFEKLIQLMEIFYNGNYLCVTESSLKEFNILNNEITALYDFYKNNFKENTNPQTMKNEDLTLGIFWYSENFNKRELFLVNLVFEEIKKKYKIFFITNVKNDELANLTKYYRNIYLNINNLENTYQKLNNLNLDLCFLVSPKPQNPFHKLNILLNRRISKKYIIFNSDIVSRGYPFSDLFLIYEKKDYQDQFSEKCIFLENYIEKNMELFYSSKSNLNEKTIDFFSSAHTLKLNFNLLEAWIKILQINKNANLVLAPFPDNFYKNNILFLNIEKICSKLKVDKNRIKILDISGQDQINKILSKSKVYLDSYPYTGSTTIVDVISHNLQIVTMRGSIYISNFSRIAIESLRKSSCDRDKKYFTDCIKIFYNYEDYIYSDLNLLKKYSNNKYLNLDLKKNKIINQTTKQSNIADIINNANLN